MTGHRIAFGTIAVQPEPASGGGAGGGANTSGGAGECAFLAFIDGQYTGQNLTRMESIPAGERRVDILPLTDDPRNAPRHTVTVTLPPDGIVTVRYPAAVTHPWFVPRLIAFEEYDDQDRGQDQLPEADLDRRGIQSGSRSVALYRRTGGHPRRLFSPTRAVEKQCCAVSRGGLAHRWHSR